MGLDTWIRVRTEKDLNTESTGVCSGLFGVTTAEEGTQEIGYFRKCWLITNLFLEHSIEQDTEGVNNIEIDLNCLDEIEKIIDIFLTYQFDEEGYIIIPRDEEGDLESYDPLIDRYIDEAMDCFNLEGKLEEAKEMIAKIRLLQKEDANLKLYLSYWY